MPTHKEKRTLMDIFSDYSPSKMSNGQIRMRCPFRENHKDGRGQMSFFVSPEINAYHCFSCGAKGSLIRLLTVRFGVNYFEAVELVRLSPLTERPSIKEKPDIDIMWDFTKVPGEFSDRNYPSEVMRHFRVGMTSDGKILIPYYEDFNNPRKLLGYQTRTYEGDFRVVRNSVGFDKKEYLYNLDLSYEYVVLVEGQSDVWRLYQYGYNAVALMGSSLSQWQIEALANFDRVYLALDNDEAGRRCVEVCNRLLRNYVQILLVPYTTKDPGESSKKEWVSAFSKSTDYAVYSMEMSMNWEGYLDMREKVLNELSHKSVWE